MFSGLFNRDTLVNKNGGGGGRLPAEYVKFVYVLIKKRKSAQMKILFSTRFYTPDDKST